MQLEGRRRIQKAVDITPLIDVVFQLILFFMLTSSLVQQQGMEVVLPKAEGATEVEEEAVVVSVTEDGEVYFRKELVSLPELTERIKSRGAQTGGVSAPADNGAVIVKSDSGVRVERLVQVMDSIRQGGAQNVAIATEQPS